MTQVSRPSDGEMLAEFLTGRGQTAFTDLVDRHRAMVHGVAFRVLADHHEAQDVTQTVFLTLACKAAGLRRGPSVGSWLHTVARRLAQDVRNTRVRRQLRETAAMHDPSFQSGPAQATGPFRGKPG